MKQGLVLLTIVLVAPALASSQTETPSTSQGSNPPTALHRNHVTITGCLTKNPHNEYELVDQKGTNNLLYGSIVNLSSYVGQFVTLVGDRSATPSTDAGTARPMPHFLVRKVRLASGECKK